MELEGVGYSNFINISTDYCDTQMFYEQNSNGLDDIDVSSAQLNLGPATLYRSLSPASTDSVLCSIQK